MTSALVSAICLLVLAVGALGVRVWRLRAALASLQSRLDAVDAARRESELRLERFARARPQELAAARRDALEPLLVLDDHVLRARRAAELADGAGLREGIEGLARDVERAWGRAGLERLFPADGEAFDPAIHEAIARVSAAGEPCGPVVAHVEQAGFRAGEVLVRPARVVVRVAEEADVSPGPVGEQDVEDAEAGGEPVLAAGAVAAEGEGEGEGESEDAVVEA